MAAPKGHHPGATWHKCDFQCHTPRDRGWDGASNLPGGKPELEQARLNWAKQFVQACVDRGLGAVAVTDHHDLGLFKYVREAAVRAAKPLIVFPGMEITCSDDAQCLAILDPASSDDVLTKLVGKLPGVLVAAPEAAKGCEVLHAKISVQELFDAVADDDHLRDTCGIHPVRTAARFNLA